MDKGESQSLEFATGSPCHKRSLSSSVFICVRLWSSVAVSPRLFSSGNKPCRVVWRHEIINFSAAIYFGVGGSCEPPSYFTHERVRDAVEAHGRRSRGCQCRTVVASGGPRPAEPGRRGAGPQGSVPGAGRRPGAGTSRAKSLSGTAEPEDARWNDRLSRSRPVPAHYFAGR